MALDGVLLAETIGRAPESVEQDQTARMCRLILIYALRKFSTWSQTAGYGLKVCSTELKLLTTTHIGFNYLNSRSLSTDLNDEAVKSAELDHNARMIYFAESVEQN